MFLLKCRHDSSASHKVAANWFAKVQASVKQLFLFRGFGARDDEEQRKRFLVHLVNDVFPLRCVPVMRRR